MCNSTVHTAGCYIGDHVVHHTAACRQPAVCAAIRPSTAAVARRAPSIAVTALTAGGAGRQQHHRRREHTNDQRFLLARAHTHTLSLHTPRQLSLQPPSREAGATSAEPSVRAAGWPLSIITTAMLRKWLQSLCSSHSRWLQWLWPSHLTQNGCDIASSAMRARPGAGGMAAAASFQPSLLRMAALCVSQPSAWRLWLHCS